MAFSIETQFDSLMFQAFSLQAVAYSGLAQNIHGALLQNSSTDAGFDVFAGVALEDDRFDTLQVQQVSEGQSRGAGSDDSDLCAYCGHCG